MQESGPSGYNSTVKVNFSFWVMKSDKSKNTVSRHTRGMHPP